MNRQLVLHHLKLAHSFLIIARCDALVASLEAKEGRNESAMESDSNYVEALANAMHHITECRKERKRK